MKWLKKLKPNLIAKNIQSVNFAKLKEQGITNLILDIDDTLISRRSTNITPLLFEWVANRKSDGFNLCLASNSRHPVRVEYIGKTLGLPHLSFGLKPLPFAFQRAMRVLGSRPDNTAMIGDQLFMDILGANLLGIYSILVQNITPETMTVRQFMRWLEDWVLAKLKSL